MNNYHHERKVEVPVETRFSLENIASYSKTIACIYSLYLGSFIIYAIVSLFYDTNLSYEIHYTIRDFNSIPILVLLALVILVFLGSMTYLIIQLFTFSSHTYKSIMKKDDDLLEKGLKALRNYFFVLAIAIVIGLIMLVYYILKTPYLFYNF